MERSPFNWFDATREDNKALYRAVLHERQRQRVSWHDLFKAAFGGEIVGERYEDNFRKGRIAKTKAAQIFDWLATTNPCCRKSAGTGAIENPSRSAGLGLVSARLVCSRAVSEFCVIPKAA